jgi:hypothetical protein
MKLREPILKDNSPVFAGFYYVVDGEVFIPSFDGTVADLKKDAQAQEVRVCDINNRGLPLVKSATEIVPPKKERLEYRTTTRIWLFLDYYYDQGITPEEASEVISELRDPVGVFYFAPKIGLGNRLVVETDGKGEGTITHIVKMIEFHLAMLVSIKSAKV